MEFAPLVALRSTLGVFRLARAELAEVLGRFGDGRGEELHFDTAEGFTYAPLLRKWITRSFVRGYIGDDHEMLILYKQSPTRVLTRGRQIFKLRIYAPLASAWCFITI